MPVKIILHEVTLVLTPSIDTEKTDAYLNSAFSYVACAEYEQKITQFQQERQRLTKQHRQQLDKLETKSYALIESQVTAKANADRIAPLEQALSKSEDKIQALNEFVSQDKANLAGQIKQLESAIPRGK